MENRGPHPGGAARWNTRRSAPPLEPRVERVREPRGRPRARVRRYRPRAEGARVSVRLPGWQVDL